MSENANNEKNKIIAVVILAVVALALAYVRFVRPPSRSAARPPQDAAAASAIEIPALPDWLEASAPAAAPLPRRVPTRDIFAPPPLPPGGRGPPGAAATKLDLRLSAIMRGKEGALAVIGGFIFKKGDQLGPYTVEQVGGSQVVLSSTNDRIVLTVGAE